ncbi:MAG: hypothetical protein AAFR29_03825 [Pseudomonadota bacterium]
MSIFNQGWHAIGQKPTIGMVQIVLLLGIFLVILDAAHTIDGLGDHMRGGDGHSIATPQTPSQCLTIIF